MDKTKLRKIIVAIVIALIVAAYFGSPIDFIPDFISGFGLIDDFGMVALGLIGELINFLVGGNVIHRKNNEYSNENQSQETYSEPMGEYRELD